MTFVLVGYSAFQKGYKLYDLENKNFFVSGDVVFTETFIPFKGSVTDQQSHTVPHDIFFYDDLVAAPDSDFSVIQEGPQVETPSFLVAPSISSVDTVMTDQPPEVMPVVESTAPPDIVRRSTRGSRPPIWHKNYVTKADSTSCLYFIAKTIDCTGLSAKYQSFVSKFSAEVEPTSYSEAAIDERWASHES